MSTCFKFKESDEPPVFPVEPEATNCKVYYLEDLGTQKFLHDTREATAEAIDIALGGEQSSNVKYGIKLAVDEAISNAFKAADDLDKKAIVAAEVLPRAGELHVFIRNPYDPAAVEKSQTDDDSIKTEDLLAMEPGIAQYIDTNRLKTSGRGEYLIEKVIRGKGIYEKIVNAGICVTHLCVEL